MYQATRREHVYVAEPSPRWRRFVQGLLWLNFVMLVLNGALAMIFWLSGVGPAYVSLMVAFLSCLVIVFFTQFARRHGVVTLTPDGISYHSPAGKQIGPLAWDDIAQVRLERSVGRAWLWLHLRKSGRRISLLVPWEEAEEIDAQCQRNLRL